MLLIADLFAAIASQSFKYKVDRQIIKVLSNNDRSMRMFICFYNDIPAACGLIFYDQYGYAGLHMIGTLPEFRGKGLAHQMTIHLLNECIKDKKMRVVLHASEAGERVYLKLGFTPLKQIVTYSLLN
ncbi:GNAT family N-acetyltransferase [Pedobacter sp. PAMC26386]|nr:GNAT family N-acetyltransferase [Pedobacter sp. PAMC26386]